MAKLKQPLPSVWAQTTTLLKGKTIIESGGLPLLVQDEWGKGKIIYLALDAGRPPLSTWNGLAKFLQNLLTTALSDGAPKRPQWNEAIFSQLLLSPSFVAAYIPTASLSVAIVVYLAGVFALSGLWQRRRITWRTLVLSCGAWILVERRRRLSIFQPRRTSARRRVARRDGIWKMPAKDMSRRRPISRCFRPSHASIVWPLDAVGWIYCRWPRRLMPSPRRRLVYRYGERRDARAARAERVGL